jgi:hypothetical protein
MTALPSLIALCVTNFLTLLARLLAAFIKPFWGIPALKW